MGNGVKVFMPMFYEVIKLYLIKITQGKAYRPVECLLSWRNSVTVISLNKTRHCRSLSATLEGAYAIVP
jgi:hypothetical protein